MRRVDIYHVWCDLKSGVSDQEFCTSASRYLDHLQAIGQLHSYRITRRKLGLGPADIPEFHLMLEFDDLSMLDAAFHSVSAHAEPVEGLHVAVNSKVEQARFALYRDFPDSPHNPDRDGY